MAGGATDPAEHGRKKYTEKNALLLVARAAGRFMSICRCAEPWSRPRLSEIPYGPLLDVFMLDMRSYRGPNGEEPAERYGPETYFLGPTQVAWLKRELLTSQATWEMIAADMPIGLFVVYDADRKWGVEAIAQGDGPPAAASLRSPTCSPLSSGQGCATPLAHSRCALHRRALLRSEQGGVSGLRAVLGIRVRPDPCGMLRAK